MKIFDEAVTKLETKIRKVAKKETSKRGAIHRHETSIKKLQDELKECGSDKKSLENKIAIFKTIDLIFEEWRAGVEKLPAGKFITGIIFDSSISKFLQSIGLGTVEEILNMTPEAILKILKKNSEFFNFFMKKLREQGYSFQE